MHAKFLHPNRKNIDFSIFGLFCEVSHTILGTILAKNPKSKHKDLYVGQKYANTENLSILA